jgi:hypothetical protein
MSEDEKQGPIERIKQALHRDSDADDVDPIEIERLSLTDTTETERADTPAGTGFAGDELPPDVRKG